MAKPIARTFWALLGEILRHRAFRAGGISKYTEPPVLLCYLLLVSVISDATVV